MQNMQNPQDYFPPVWLMGQKWQVEYFFEQKMFNMTLDVASTIPENFVPKSETWEYQVYGQEKIHDRDHIVLRATPVAGVGEEMLGTEFQMYFEKDARSLHGFKRKEASPIGMPRVEYVRNPWGPQSFFTSAHEHLIMDWPQVDINRVQKEIGIGRLGFVQKDFFDRAGFIVELGNGKSTTVQTYQRGGPWWTFADKLLVLPDRTIHVQGKLVGQNPQDDPLMGGQDQ